MVPKFRFKKQNLIITVVAYLSNHCSLNRYKYYDLKGQRLTVHSLWSKGATIPIQMHAVWHYKWSFQILKNHRWNSGNRIIMWGAYLCGAAKEEYDQNLSAILKQEGHTMAFWSRTLLSRTTSFSCGETGSSICESH